MKLDEQINQALVNLSVSVKALKIATDQLHKAATKIDEATKPKLTVVKNEKET